MFDIKEQLKKLPEKPGVYLMKDAGGNIIYVGKSKLLKNRVSSYFRAFNSHPPKTQTMVVNIKEFEYFITDTEMEALILEQTLIKKYKPRFNILLRDDKQYPYIKVTITEDFPRVFMTRKVLKDKAEYYGPYTNVDAMKKTLEVMHSVYPIRKCSKAVGKKIERPCLNYHIKKCMGPCNGLVNKDAYRVYIDEIRTILSGKHEHLAAEIQRRMMVEAGLMNYEKAAMYRDYLNAVNVINEKQKVVYEENVEQDVIGTFAFEDRICIMVFFIRGGKITGRDQHILDGVAEMAPEAVLSDFMTQYYAGVEMVPREILLPYSFEGMDLVETWLCKKSNRKIKLSLPQKGEKRKLVDLVVENAKEYIEKFKEKIEYDLLVGKQLNDAFKGVLGSGGLGGTNGSGEQIDRDIYRLEIYDISNLYGVYSVGTMVVYENWRKKPTDYRKFKVRTIDGADDYGSMREMILRRFSRGMEERKHIMETGVRDADKFAIFPDIIMIDGGKGHVSVIEETLRELKINIPVMGLVKNDKHRTEKLYYDGAFYEIKGNRDLFKFATEMQDEVHRFAIEYHRNVRSKSMTGSLLDEVEGIGESRKKRLLKHFGSIEAMKRATLDELTAVDGMNKKAAEKLAEFLAALVD